MQTLMIPFTPRYFVLTACAILTVMFFFIGLESLKAFEIAILPFLLFGALTLLGIRDLTQKRHAVLRNYPISAHLRFLLESIRPEMRQYFFESEKDGTPFSRDQRALVYQRAKIDLDKRPFGTQYNVYQEGYEWVNHSVSPKPITTEKFRITVGGPDCKKPYSASVFNISAMSFGSLSANAIRALNGGAKKGNFAHDTGEGGVSPYHQEIGGDLIWEIGSGYFGCRTRDARFDPEKFVKLARTDQVKMIEVKISQGAKPGHGGVLPAAKVSKEIAAIRGIELGEDCISPPRHSAFSTPIEMMQFIAQLRTLSDGKPVGFKLCIGHPWEFLAICKAMLETKIYPDFIVVDGKEGGTGAAPLEFMDHLGMPMREGVNFVHNALVGINARDRIRIGTSGKIIDGLRHRARDGARRRLVQFGARLHVLAGLHPVAELPHRQMSDRRRHAGSGARPRASRPRQDRARLQLPSLHAARAGGADGCVRLRSSERDAADPFQPPGLELGSDVVCAALSLAPPRRVARGHVRPALQGCLGDGPAGQFFGQSVGGNSERRSIRCSLFRYSPLTPSARTPSPRSPLSRGRRPVRRYTATSRAGNSVRASLSTQRRCRRRRLRIRSCW